MALADAPPEEGNPSKRRKVTRACDRCKARKRRCDGDYPCGLCLSHGVRCGYDAPHLRGHPPAPRLSSATSDLTQGPVLSGPTQNAQTTLPGVSRDGPALEDINANSSSRPSRAASPTGEGSTQPGHYLGPTSTFSFLRRAGRRFGRITEENKQADSRPAVSIFANGDVEFATDGESSTALPREATTLALVKRYFDFAVPSHRFFHQPTVESWVRSHSQIPEACDRLVHPIREAAIYLIIATALLYKVDEHGNATGATDALVGSGSEKLRECYYQAAQARLQQEKGIARLESVQARLASVLYLLNTSRLNQAWYMLGTTYQLIIALGFHSSRSSAGPVSNCITQECKKRCYWVAFTIDTYFSVMLGRPALMSENGVDQPYPALTNDENITTDSVCKGSIVRDSVQAAPVFHARLAKIIRDASSEQYLAHKLPLEQQIDTVDRLNNRISQWHFELPMYLSGGIHPATLVPIFRRQLRVLQMAAAHATMIVNRPLILTSRENAALVESHVDRCVDAASRVLEMVLELVDSNHLFRAFWNFQYITFHALSVVYVWMIQLRRDRQRTSSVKHDRGQLCELAEKVQAHLAEATQLNAPNLRYSIILEELRQEALRSMNAVATRHQRLEIAPVNVDFDHTQHESPAQGSSLTGNSDWGSMLDFDTNPELWLQLDSFPFDDVFAQHEY